ncbi:phage tail length tape measure family protein [Paraburkholderia sp. LEh10]|uniref:phage tail length tape measure family protein n=1 Tax=Paraburkholderia sp. LEh10 TaxID=2821353 RepID=UPI001AE7EEF9|nr:phage tail length tape measure family protein [Paraburkholderia sp. LEh10]
MDATEARQGFSDVKDSARDMARTVVTESASAGKAIDSIGNGSGASSQKVESATRSMIQSIQRTTAAMEAGSRSSAQYYEVLANQRGVSVDALRPYLEQLEAVRTRQEQASAAMSSGSASMERTGMSARALAAAMREVPAQFTDIVTGLVDGQRPMAVLMQQGGQLKDMFGGIGAAARGLATYIASLVTPMTLGAAAAAGLAYAYYEAAQDAKAFNAALALTNNYAGLTATSMQEMAQRVAQATNSGFSRASDVLLGLAESGKYTAAQMESLATVIARTSEISGKSLDEVSKMYEGLADDPVKWATAHTESMHFMDTATYQLIKSMQDVGDKSDAVQKVIEASAKQVEYSSAQHLTKAAQAWHDLSIEIETFWKKIKQGVSTGPSMQDQIDTLLGERQDIQGNMFSAGRIAEIDNRIAALKRLQRAQADNAALQAANTQRRQAGVEAAQRIEKMSDAIMSNEEKRTKELKQLAKDRAAILADGGTLSDSDYARMQKDIADKYKDPKSPKSTADSTSNRDVAALKAEIQARQQQLALIDQYGLKQDKVSEGDKKVLQIEQQLGLAQKDRIGKVTDAQLKEQLGYAQQLAALDKQIDAVTRAKQAQQDYNDQVTKWAQSEQTAKDALAQDVALYGTEGEARKLMTVQLQYEAQARETITKAQREGHPLSEQQQKDLLAEADARAKVVGGIEAQRDALAGAKQLQQENEKFAANSILDEKQRAAAIRDIDAKKWQDLIANAGDGTEAQKKLIEQYNQWYADQSNKPVLDQWKNTVSQIDRDFHDGFLQMLSNGEKGWKSFTQSLKNTFEVTVVDALYKAFAQKFVINVVANVAGMVGGDTIRNDLLGANGANAASGVGGVSDGTSGFGMLSKAFGNGTFSGVNDGLAHVSRLFGGLSSGSAASLANAEGGDVLGNYLHLSGNVGSSAGEASSSLPRAGTNGGMGDFGAVVGSAGTGFAIGSLYGGTGAKVGGTVGALAGSLVLPGIGTLVGAALGGLVGSLFGGGETRSGASYVSDASGNLTKFAGPSGGDPAASQTMQQITGTFDTIQQMAGELGGDLSGLGQFKASYEVSPKKGNSFVSAGFTTGGDAYPDRTDLSGVKDPTTVLNDFSLKLQQSVIASLQKANLDKPYADYLGQFNASTLTADQVTQIEQTLNSLHALFDSIQTMGADFDNLKNASTSAQLAVINLSGGVDKFASNAGYFEQHFVPATEQVANQAKSVTDQLAKLGMSGIRTNEQFRAAVEGIDLTTDAGQKLYVQMLALAPAFDQMTQAAQQAADAQQSLWDNYFGAVYTSGQQLAMSTKQLQDRFNALGVSMPKTNAAFQALVENMDTSDPKVKALQNSLLALAPAFGQVMSAADQAAQAAQQAAQQAVQTALGNVQTAYNNQVQALQSNIDATNQFIDSLKGLKQSLTLGDLSTLSPQDKYLAEKQQFGKTSAAAAAGDKTAQGQLPQVAQDFLNASKAYNASSQAYVDDFNAVQSALDSNIATAQAQLSTAQQQLAADNQMVQGILDLNQTAQSLEDAVKAYFAAGGTSSAGSGGAAGAGMNRAQVLATADPITGLIPYSDANPYGPMGGITGAEWDAANAAGPTAAFLAANPWIAELKALHGSHAGGLDSVPFDGYRAELHKGEAVVTSANNQKLSQMLNIDWSRFGSGDNTALLNEIKALRAEVSSLKGTVATVGVAQMQQADQHQAENRVDMSKQTRHLQNTADNTGKIANQR